MQQADPVFYETIPLSLEEIFISETEVVGYDVKNLYFKLMREDWKNRLWAPALIALSSFFAYPVLLAFLAGKAYRDWNTAGKHWVVFQRGCKLDLTLKMV